VGTVIILGIPHAAKQHPGIMWNTERDRIEFLSHPYTVLGLECYLGSQL